MNILELKEKYKIEIDLLFSSKQTKLSYISACNKFISENEFVYNLSIDDLKKYFSEFRQRYSDSYYNIICSAVKIFYEKCLNQPQKMKWFKAIKSEPKFHNIITESEFNHIMKNISQVKHRLFTLILYSTGIRINELLDIKLCDIDIINQTIYIHTEKGGKNRFVFLHDLVIKCYHEYIKTWKPKEYLFEGQFGGRYSETSVRNVLKKASKDIDKNIYPHLFRHTIATKTIEKENVFLTMELLGHRSLKSTLCYNHISPERLKNMYNPLNKI